MAIEKDRRVIIQANFAVHELRARLTPDEKRSYSDILGVYLGILKSFGESIEDFIYGYKHCGMTAHEYIKETFSWSSGWKPRELTEKEEDWLLFTLTPAIEHLSQAHNNSTISQKIADAHDVLCKFKNSEGYITYLKDELGPDKWLYFPDEASPPHQVVEPEANSAEKKCFAKAKKNMPKITSTTENTQNNVPDRSEKGQVKMEKEQGLKTLGDYRKAARDTLFDRGLIPKSESKSFYDAIKIALLNCRELITYSRSDLSIAGLWDAIILPHTKYEMRNPPLFDSIKLMEFVITYRHVKFIDDVYKNWPVRPDVNAMVFTSAGMSFLEAAFRFVFEMGCDIIGILQNAYREHIREGNIIYASPFKFLDKTPSVDDLKINPLPDIIIRTWFDEIMEGVKKEFPENEFSHHKLTAEFNLVKRQLEYEWSIWNKNTETPSVEKTGTAGNTKKLGKSLDLYDVIESLRHYKKSQNISALPPIQQVYDTLCKHREKCGAKTTDTIDWLGSAARDNSGYYPALLQELTSDEVMAYIEEWNQKSQTNGMAGDKKATNRTIDLFKVPIAELTKQGESRTLEFKETLEYDTQQNRKNNDVLFSSLKALAGFLNAAGGTLLIGVHDSGEIKGIEKDLSVMKRGNNDRFEQQIRNYLRSRFEPQPIGKVDVSFEKLEEKTICRIDIQASKEPIHLDDEVYVREGNTTQLLKGRRLTDWIQQRKLSSDK